MTPDHVFGSMDHALHSHCGLSWQQSPQTHVKHKHPSPHMPKQSTFRKRKVAKTHFIVLILQQLSPAMTLHENLITSSAVLVLLVNFSYKESRNNNAHVWLMIPNLSPSSTYMKYRVFTITI